MSSRRLLVCACLAIATVPPALVAAEVLAPPPDPALGELAARVRAAIDAMIIARPPRLVPPRPIKPAYKLTRFATLDLGAPLAAFAASDLDGDGKAELYAVTAREVIAIAADGKPRILGRVAFAGEPPPTQPRDVVASIAFEGTSLVAAASPWAQGLRARWQNGTLVATQTGPGFPQCFGELATLARGRNYYTDPAGDHYGIACTSALVDAEGYPLRARAQLSLGNKLDIAIERCAATGLGCQPAARHEHPGVGIAFAIGDVDRDGTPELVHAGAGAPGDADALVILTLHTDGKKQQRLRKAFAGAGVAGIAVADIDGNGASEVIAAVRASGSPKLELWRVL